MWHCRPDQLRVGARRSLRRCVQGMCDLIAHRGPDGSGVWTRGSCRPGPSPAGDHRSERRRRGSRCRRADGQIWLTFNGEIYNFLELRAELEARGHRFHSHTDSEVILSAYREYGVDCLSGCAACSRSPSGTAAGAGSCSRAIGSARSRSSTATDRDGLAFASEPKAFLADPVFAATPNAAALSAYLTYQYVPAPMSAFAGVAQAAACALPPRRGRPGHRARATGSSVTRRRRNLTEGRGGARSSGRALREAVQAPAGQRRAARRVPERRHRFRRDRRAHGGARRGAGPHVLDRLRGKGIRRARVRAARRQALRNRARGVRRPAERAGRSSRGWCGTTTSRSRTRRPSRRSSCPS